MHRRVQLTAAHRASRGSLTDAARTPTSTNKFRSNRLGTEEYYSESGLHVARGRTKTKENKQKYSSALAATLRATGDYARSQQPHCSFWRKSSTTHAQHGPCCLPTGRYGVVMFLPWTQPQLRLSINKTYWVSRVCSCRAATQHTPFQPRREAIALPCPVAMCRYSWASNPPVTR